MSSIFKKQSLVATYPARNVFKREAHIALIFGDGPALSVPLVELTSLEKLALKAPGYYNHCGTYMINTVASYAIAKNECPMAACQRAKDNGHELHFIFACSSVLTSHKCEPETCIEVECGMLVRIEGFIAKIEKAPNDNLKLVPVDLDQYRKAA